MPSADDVAMNVMAGGTLVEQRRDIRMDAGGDWKPEAPRPGDGGAVDPIGP